MAKKRTSQKSTKPTFNRGDRMMQSLERMRDAISNTVMTDLDWSDDGNSLNLPSDSIEWIKAVERMHEIAQSYETMYHALYSTGDLDTILDEWSDTE